MEGIIKEVQEAKNYLTAGLYEECYVCLRNIEDELISFELKKE